MASVLCSGEKKLQLPQGKFHFGMKYEARNEKSRDRDMKSRERLFRERNEVVRPKWDLPGEVGERSVGLSHLVRIFLLLYGVSFFLLCKDEFVGQCLVHWNALLLAGSGDNPP